MLLRVGKNLQHFAQQVPVGKDCAIHFRYRFVANLESELKLLGLGGVGFADPVEACDETCALPVTAISSSRAKTTRDLMCSLLIHSQKKWGKRMLSPP